MYDSLVPFCVQRTAHFVKYIKKCTMPTTPNPVLSFSDFVISFHAFFSWNTESRTQYLCHTREELQAHYLYLTRYTVKLLISA